MSNQDNQTPRKRINYQRTFEFSPSPEAENNLNYFVKQELGYYNSLVDQLTPRLRAFPKEILNLKDKDHKLWEICAEHAINPNQMISHPVEQWPIRLQPYSATVYDQTGAVKITPNVVSLVGIAASPARLHPTTRKNMAIEILNYMNGQADTLLAAQKTETMRAPMQMLQNHTLDTKRHLQIDRKLVKIEYNSENGNSLVTIPYIKEPIVIVNSDISETRFTLMIVRAPHPLSNDRRWFIDLKDNNNKYVILLTDYNERRKNKNRSN